MLSSLDKFKATLSSESRTHRLLSRPKPLTTVPGSMRVDWMYPAQRHSGHFGRCRRARPMLAVLVRRRSSERGTCRCRGEVDQSLLPGIRDEKLTKYVFKKSSLGTKISLV